MLNSEVNCVKVRILSVGVILFLLLITCFPVFAKSNNWSFVMKQRLVDGSSNGQYYNLSKGKVKISGSVSSTKQKNPYGGNKPNPLYMALYNERFGPDEYCGQIVIKNPTKYSITKREIGSTTVADDDYYLEIYKGEKDYWTTTGSGRIFN